MRFTLGKMFLAVALLALACAGMTYRNHLWSSVILCTTLTLFVWAGMKAVYTPGASRAAAIWFLIVGIAYLLITPGPWFAGLGKYAVTNYPLTVFARLIGGIRTGRDNFNEDFSILTSHPALSDFLIIGHCVFSWIFAVLAAWLAGRMYDRRERATKVTQ